MGSVASHFLNARGKAQHAAKPQVVNHITFIHGEDRFYNVPVISFGSNIGIDLDTPNGTVRISTMYGKHMSFVEDDGGYRMADNATFRVKINRYRLEMEHWPIKYLCKLYDTNSKSKKPVMTMHVPVGEFKDVLRFQSGKIDIDILGGQIIVDVQTNNRNVIIDKTIRITPSERVTSVRKMSSKVLQPKARVRMSDIVNSQIQRYSKRIRCIKTTKVTKTSTQFKMSDKSIVTLFHEEPAAMIRCLRVKDGKMISNVNMSLEDIIQLEYSILNLETNQLYSNNCSPLMAMSAIGSHTKDQPSVEIMNGWLLINHTPIPKRRYLFKITPK